MSGSLENEKKKHNLYARGSARSLTSTGRGPIQVNLYIYGTFLVLQDLLVGGKRILKY